MKYNGVRTIIMYVSSGRQKEMHYNALGHCILMHDKFAVCLKKTFSNMILP